MDVSPWPASVRFSISLKESHLPHWSSFTADYRPLCRMVAMTPSGWLKQGFCGHVHASNIMTHRQGILACLSVRFALELDRIRPYARRIETSLVEGHLGLCLGGSPGFDTLYIAGRRHSLQRQPPRS